MQRVLIRGIKDFNVLRLSGIIIINNTESERGNMPRKSRKKSESGYYHVILRGVNRQDIFFDDEDREKMLNLLRRYQDETDVRIIAYCLMDNHIHLLVNTEEGPGRFIKKIASSYVFYFNHKYDRIGHLFQDRYTSEVVDTDSSLLTVFRYILQNPMKAGLSTSIRYPWNSSGSLERKYDFCDIKRLEDIAGNRQALKDYVLEQNDDLCLEAEPSRGLLDAEAFREVMRITGGVDPMKIAQYPREDRNLMIARMKMVGLSVRQISRLTGISRNIIQRV